MAKEHSGIGFFLAILVGSGLGASLALWVDDRRGDAQSAEAHVAILDSLILELEDSFERGHFHAAEFVARVDRWHQKDGRGYPAVPGHYRIPGAPLPPRSAWEFAVASGGADALPATLHMELAYYYEEYAGIYRKYSRLAETTERDVMPLAIEGAEAFYGADGEVLPKYRVHMELQLEFAAELRMLSDKAGRLAARLDALRQEPGNTE